MPDLTTAEMRARLEELKQGYECPNSGDDFYSVDYGLGHGHICNLCGGTGRVDAREQWELELLEEALARREREEAPNTARKASALTAANNGTLNTGDATSDSIIGNMRTRIAELESKLQAYGLLN